MQSTRAIFGMLAAALSLGVLLTACAESERPAPTGKAAFRGVNAISSAPTVALLIEERTLGTADFKESTAAQRFDDFTYNMNFEAVLAGDSDPTRIATAQIDTVADQDYMLVLTGQVSAPQIIVWEKAERIWEGTETVFQMDFGHAADTIGEFDVYFDVAGTAPVLGNAVGSLRFGETLPPIDREAGDYEILITARDDPASVIYQSGPITYIAATAITATILDADPSITGNIALRRINAVGQGVETPDVNVPGTVRFLHGAFGTDAVDVSINGDTANPVATDIAFGEITGDIELPSGATDFTYTAAGNPGAILHEVGSAVTLGARASHLLSGTPGSLAVTPLTDDRRPRETSALIRYTNLSSNNTLIDIYVLDPGTDITEEDLSPTVNGLPYLVATTYVSTVADAYELWVTVAGDTSMVLAGPTPLDVANGDNVEIAVLDTADPAMVDPFFYSP